MDIKELIDLDKEIIKIQTFILKEVFLKLEGNQKLKNKLRT
jgi:hypothetical protein